MTVTEAPPTPASDDVPVAERAQPTGIEALLSTGDHKSVGRAWIALSLVFLLGTSVAGLFAALERVDTSGADLLSTHVLQTQSTYRVGGFLLVALPLAIGVATAVVPLQVGARTVAFPRAAALGLWTWLLGAGLFVGALFADGGPGGGSETATDLWLVALGLVLVGLCVATVSVVTTIVALRAPDMTLRRVPAFSWSMLAAGTIWLVTLPVAVANVVATYLDHRYGQLAFGTPEAVWDNFVWLFDQPAVYMAAVPALGVLAEIVPVTAGRAQRYRGVVLGAIAAFAILSFGAYAQPAVSAEFVDSIPYVGAAFLVGVPVLVLLGGAGDTVSRGQLRLHPPAILAFAAIDLLLLGALLGAVASIDPLDLLGTTWQWGQTDAVWLAALGGGLAGVLWWGPKLSGRLAPGSSGWALAGLLLLGGALLAIPQAIAGALDQPAYGIGFEARDGVEALNVVAVVGAVVIVLAAIVALVVGLGAVAVSRGEADPDAADPWGGHTLEWSTASPPPTDDFPDGVPVVTSATPLLGDDEGDGSDGPSEEEA